jgi:hypothetical protein
MASCIKLTASLTNSKEHRAPRKKSHFQKNPSLKIAFPTDKQASTKEISICRTSSTEETKIPPKQTIKSTHQKVPNKKTSLTSLNVKISQAKSISAKVLTSTLKPGLKNMPESIATKIPPKRSSCPIRQPNISWPNTLAILSKFKTNDPTVNQAEAEVLETEAKKAL